MKCDDSILATVSFLSDNFAEAVSLSLGRPNPEVYAALDLNLYRETYESHLRERLRYDENQVLDHLYNYGPTQGIINYHIQLWLKKEEKINILPKSLFITNGCQEAYNLILHHELREENDCVLIIEPSYFGFSECVSVLGKTAVTVSVDDIISPSGSFDFNNLRSLLDEYVDELKKIKLIYINPDFNNPMTYQLTTSEKTELLDICNEYSINIIEDSTYASFHYDNEKNYSIKSQDRYGLVYYVGSFSKIMCPSVRLGYLVLNRQDDEIFARILHIKERTSLSTSALNQQIVGGFLIRYDYLLEEWFHPIRNEYRSRRDCMLQVIDSELKDSPVSWIEPKGGFFVYLKLPFAIASADLLLCAEKYQATFLPVSYFSRRDGKAMNGIRLAFSYHRQEMIEKGTRSVCHFLKEKAMLAG